MRMTADDALLSSHDAPAAADVVISDYAAKQARRQCVACIGAQMPQDADLTLTQVGRIATSELHNHSRVRKASRRHSHHRSSLPLQRLRRAIGEGYRDIVAVSERLRPLRRQRQDRLPGAVARYEWSLES